MDDYDYQQFTDKFYQMTGINLQLYKEKQMRRRLTSFIANRGFASFLAFYHRLREDNDLLHQFLDRITINVSEFFRNPNRWQVLEKEILPLLLEKKQRLSCWSAACSTGEEPYTLYMILSDLLPAGQFSILATDVDEAVLARAKEGVYTQKNIALVPQDKVAKYLRRSGSTYLIAPEAKKEIQFKKQDLLTDAYMGTFDLIVCRNVLIYFKDEAKEAIYYRFNRSLNPGGILFVGSTEQIFNPDKYGFQAIRPFFYQKL